MGEMLAAQRAVENSFSQFQTIASWVTAFVTDGGYAAVLGLGFFIIIIIVFLLLSQ